jgi:maleate cis-trans isomerase
MDLKRVGAVLIPDTALPSPDNVNDLEAACQLPMLTANLVTMWTALGLARRPLVTTGYGQIFTIPCKEHLA